MANVTLFVQLRLRRNHGGPNTMCKRSETSGTSPSSAELAESETAETLTLRANGSSLYGARAIYVKGGERPGVTAEASR